jgi:transposase
MGNAKGVKRDFEALERRRLKAVKLFKKGLGQSEVGRRLKVPRQTAHRWYCTWRRDGVAALRKAGRAGRKPRVSAKSKARITEALIAGPRANGFTTDVWTLPRVAQLVEDLCGVKYHPDHMSRMMKLLGFSCQRPTTKARERDERKILEWKRTVWPGIKKKPKNRGE